MFPVNFMSNRWRRCKKSQRSSMNVKFTYGFHIKKHLCHHRHFNAVNRRHHPGSKTSGSRKISNVHYLSTKNRSKIHIVFYSTVKNIVQHNGNEHWKKKWSASTKNVLKSNAYIFLFNAYPTTVWHFHWFRLMCLVLKLMGR